MSSSIREAAAVPSGFHDELAPWLIVARNALESARMALADELADARRIDEALARNDAERSTLAAEAISGGGVMDLARHTRRIEWLVTLGDRGAAIRARRDATEVRIEAARARCIERASNVQALEQRRDEALLHWQLEQQRRELAEADADWIARTGWQDAQDPVPPITAGADR
jgi:hypothetical protein